LVAGTLGLRYLGGGEALKMIARKRGHSSSGENWWDTEEGMGFLQERARNPSLDREVDAELLRAVDEGNVVITSYTLPWLTSKGLKFWLSASVENRAKRMAGRDGTSYEEASRVVQERDAQNLRLYRELYGFEFGVDLSVFDFVLSTDRLSKEQVADIVLCVTRKVE